jgi:Cu(I)/Ag(I) efflux system membrane fusion protein
MRRGLVRWIIPALAVALVFAVPSLRRGLKTFFDLSQTTGVSRTYYTCPMHPEIRLPQAGECPICGMSLVEKHAGEEAHSGVVTVTPRQVQLTGVTTAPVSRRALVRAINAYGTVDYDETRLAVVSAWVGGRIDQLYVDFTGVTVEKGHPLVSLYSPDLIAASKEYTLSIAGLERARETNNERVLRSAEEMVAASRQRLRRWGLTDAQIDEIARGGGSDVDHVTIYAPQGGTVIERMAVEGMYVEQGDVLFRVADLSSVWLSAEVYEDDIPHLYQQRAGDYYLCPMHTEVTSQSTGSCPKCGMELIRTNDEVKAEITARAFPGEVFEGKVAFTDPVLNPETRTVRVRVNIENRDFKLKPNMYARAAIRLPAGEMLAVPESAVLQSGSRTVVLVEEAPGRFRPQPVLLGRMWLDAESGEGAAGAAGRGAEREELTFKREARRYHEVIEGLREGDRVVTSGNFLVGSESQLQGALAKMLDDSTGARGGDVTEIRDGAAPQARTPAPDPAFDPGRARRLLDAYDAIASALAADRLSGIGAAAKTIGAVAPNDVVRRAAAPFEHAEHADDIAQTRRDFLALSNALIDYASANRVALAAAGLDRARRVHCPMYPGDWLQRGDEVMNPYYGAKMLHCGVFKSWDGGETD